MEHKTNKKNKNRTQYVFDTTICKQTPITLMRNNSSHKQPVCIRKSQRTSQHETQNETTHDGTTQKLKK